MSSVNRLGELLVRDKKISLAQLRQAQDEQKRSGQNLAYALSKLGFISDREIADFISREYRVPSIDLSAVEIDAELGKLVSKEVCERHRIVPISRAGSSLIVAMSDPTNLNAIDDIKFLTGYNVEPVVASENAILHTIEGLFTQAAPESLNLDDYLQDLADENVEFASDEDESGNVLELEKAAEDAPVVRLCNAILLNAIKVRASDIHVEPYEKKMRVRYRVDGVLREEMSPPLKLRNAISSRIKIMSNLDIAERRLPQDGRIKLKMGGGKEMDFRVSVLPTIWGEKIVMRLLDKTNLQLDITKLGFEKQQLEWFMNAIHNPFGMCLVTGPTGSGKTTTLYSALSELNKTSENISTAEDPVEYNLAGINQVQMHDDIGLNFAAALRSFLRQDPDIIMVGEIRDFETAEIAVKAALTGHMVLSTLHTNDAPSTPRVQGLQAGDQGRQPGAARDRIQGGGDRAGRGAALEGRRLLDVQRHGVQGPRRALRGAPHVGRGEGPGAPGRLHRGAQDPGDPLRDAHPAHVGHLQVPGGDDHHRGDPAHHRLGHEQAVHLTAP